MGGRPITVMNIVCFPISTRDVNELAAILRGGAEKIAESGAALVGGHSVDDPEPKYGLSVTGLIDPKHITTNAGAKPGDSLVLTKPLGTGIITTAAKYDGCDQEMLNVACACMSSLNAGASRAMNSVGIDAEGVHAATDITGFGLLGHLYHLAKASGVRLRIDSNAIPILPGADEMAKKGFLTRGENDNWEYLKDFVSLAEGVSPECRSLLLDPQTSGGLAICVSHDRLTELLEALERERVETRAVIGNVLSGTPGIDIR
jgi:selenide,water dikinase